MSSRYPSLYLIIIIFISFYLYPYLSILHWKYVSTLLIFFFFNSSFVGRYVYVPITLIIWSTQIVVIVGIYNTKCNVNFKQWTASSSGKKWLGFVTDKNTRVSSGVPAIPCIGAHTIFYISPKSYALPATKKVNEFSEFFAYEVPEQARRANTRSMEQGCPTF